MGGGIFQPFMVYLSAAQCATAPEDILFKFSCCIEIVNFSAIECVLYPPNLTVPAWDFGSAARR
jgi:hypothetical protein